MASIVRSSAEWVAYFLANDDNLLDIPWEKGDGLTPEERDLIASSLPSWQLGESSDGRHLLRAAERYSAQTADPDYLEAIKLFIREEQRHGAELGRFLDLAGIPRKIFDWGDAAFRLIRYFTPRIELWATVVIGVEILALIYYGSVRRATGSEVLRHVCEQILRDEPKHLRMHFETLAKIHRNRPRVLLALTMLLGRVLFGGTTLAVWLAHRRMLRAGGFTFIRYWRTAWSKLASFRRQRNVDFVVGPVVELI